MLKLLDVLYFIDCALGIAIKDRYFIDPPRGNFSVTAAMYNSEQTVKNTQTQRNNNK